ncbi:TPA: hypothetical protein EYN98_14490 [Candidatus Poribacteria bacterium]|nr:hypothetical protein [Candidatus Poribacteria bacterium]
MIVNLDRHKELLHQDEREKTERVCKEVQETAAYARNMLRNVYMVSIIEQLLSREIVGVSTQYLFKEAGSRYADQAWQPHQDNFYPKNENGLYITSNIFLEDSDRENGTVYIYEGSHQAGLLPAEPRVSYREKIGSNPGSLVKIPDEYRDRKKDIIIPKGSVLFLHGNAIHGSYSNTSDRSRPWFSGCYIPKGEKYIIGANAKRQEIHLY